MWGHQRLPATIIICLITAAIVQSPTAAQGRDSRPSDIDILLQRIEAETNERPRYSLANELAYLVRDVVQANGGDAISDESIDGIAALLQDYPQIAASALAQIGTPAKRAVPALTTALEELEEVTDLPFIAGVDNNPVYAICDALTQITQQPSDSFATSCERLNASRAL